MAASFKPPYVVLPHPGASDAPRPLVVRESICLASVPRKTKEQMIADIRILQPGAVALMQNGYLRPYASFFLNQKSQPHEVPLAIFNPEECTPESVMHELKSPRNLRRIANALRSISGTSTKEYESQCIRKIRERSAPENAALIAQKAQALHRQMTDYYEYTLEDAEPYFGQLSRIREARGQKDPHSLSRLLTGAKTYEALVQENDAACRKLQSSISEEGAVPALTTEEAQRLDTSLRQRMADLPDEILEFLDWTAVPVWASNSVEFYKEGYALGLAYQSAQQLATLADANIKVLMEEAVHLADGRLAFVRNTDLDIKLFGETDRPVPIKEQDLLDDITCLSINKTKLRDPKGVYWVDPALEQKKLIAARDEMAAEYLANLVHCAQLPLSDGNRASLGKLLHKHMPKQYQEPKPFAGDMAQLMKEFLPVSTPFYDQFMDALQQLNQRGRSEHMPAAEQKKFRIR